MARLLRIRPSHCDLSAAVCLLVLFTGIYQCVLGSDRIFIPRCNRGFGTVRHWSPWDDQLLRVLRGEFRHDAPALSFELGSEGGVAVFHEQSEIGLWVAASRLRYDYRPNGIGIGTDAPCDMMDIVRVSRSLFSDFLEPAGRTG